MSTGAALPPLQAIHAYCVECCHGQARQVQYCPMEDCALFDYRNGRNPHTKEDYKAGRREEHDK